MEQKYSQHAKFRRQPNAHSTNCRRCTRKKHEDKRINDHK